MNSIDENGVSVASLTDTLARPLVRGGRAFKEGVCEDDLGVANHPFTVEIKLKMSPPYG
jgi:hypothetical protein